MRVVSIVLMSSGAITALWAVRARPQAEAANGTDFHSAAALIPVAAGRPMWPGARGCQR